MQKVGMLHGERKIEKILLDNGIFIKAQIEKSEYIFCLLKVIIDVGVML